tara:strand:+ start:800 stop:1579 length:780 start_codon:yes stop_codon:yes gene_type:complete
MGWGGHLMWTAVARNIERSFNQTCKPSEGSIIFKNNPLFRSDGSYNLDIGNPKTIYLHDGKRVKFKTKKHVIEWICNQFGIINNITLKCEIYLTKQEKSNAENIIKPLPKKYVCIEPHSKMTFSQARIYPFDKWQAVVDALCNEVQFVQIGASNSRRLNNAVYVDIPFRESQELLRRADLFVSMEGGLIHLANAADTKSIALFNSYFTYPSIFHYPENIIIDIALYRDQISGYKRHELYQKEADAHDPEEIIVAIKNNL